MSQPYFATVARGLEAIAVQEIESLGGRNVQPAFAGVSFEGDLSLLYRLNLWSRVLFRVLVPLLQVKAADAQELYKSVKKIDWFDYLQLEQSFAIHCTGSNALLNHTHFTALQIKNAIVDQQRERTGKRSNINTHQPDIAINAHIQHNYCQLSLDSSGFSLHRRGYRPAVGFAPLKETLAAALLAIAEWNSSQPLLDPLCGSGTLPIEAGLKALHIAPGKFHAQFCFQQWPDYQPELWQSLSREAQEGEGTELPSPIWGSDREASILQQAIANAQACHLDRHIQFQQKSLADLEAPAASGTIICNPPYGKRLGEKSELAEFYRQLGDIFKQRFKGWTAYVLTGDRDLAKQIGLKTARRFPLYNGSLPCTLSKYELY